MAKDLSRTSKKKRSLVVFLYRFFYFIVFCLIFLTWFLNRYPLPFATFLSHLAIVSSIAIYLWSIKRFGFSLERVLAGAFTGFFLVLLSIADSMGNVDNLCIITFFLLSVSVDKDDKNLITSLFYFKLIVAILVLLAYNNHIISDMTMYRSGKDLVRHSYGFMHPNSLGMYLVGLLFDFSLMKKTTKVGYGLFMILQTLLIFAITDSRLTVLAGSVLIFCYFMKPLLLKIQVSSRVIIPMIVAIFILGIGLPYFYHADNIIYTTLNHLFSKRLEFGHVYLHHFGIDWLPRKVPTVANLKGILMYDDSFYVDSLLRWGVILFLFYLTFWIVQLKEKKLTLFHTLLFLTTFLISIMEHYGASFCMCSILLINYFTVSQKIIPEDTVLQSSPS